MRAYRPLKIEVPTKGDPRVRFMFQKVVEKQVSIHQMAKAVGMDTRSIYQWRDGKTTPRMDLFEACLNTLGYTLKAVPLEKK